LVGPAVRWAHPGGLVHSDILSEFGLIVNLIYHENYRDWEGFGVLLIRFGQTQIMDDHLAEGLDHCAIPQTKCVWSGVADDVADVSGVVGFNPTELTDAF
jgi:hypothetical protein